MRMTPEQRKEYTERLVEILSYLLERHSHPEVCDILFHVCREATEEQGKTDYEYARRVLELLDEYE